MASIGMVGSAPTASTQSTYSFDVDGKSYSIDMNDPELAKKLREWQSGYVNSAVAMQPGVGMTPMNPQQYLKWAEQNGIELTPEQRAWNESAKGPDTQNVAGVGLPQGFFRDTGYGSTGGAGPIVQPPGGWPVVDQPGLGGGDPFDPTNPHKDAPPFARPAPPKFTPITGDPVIKGRGAIGFRPEIKPFDPYNAPTITPDWSGYDQQPAAPAPTQPANNQAPAESQPQAGDSTQDAIARGFTPPQGGVVTTSAMVTFKNNATGETITVPGGGWQAPVGWAQVSSI